MCDNIGKTLTGKQLKDASNGLIPDNAVVMCLNCCFETPFNLEDEFVVTSEFTFIKSNEDGKPVEHVKHILKKINYTCPSCSRLQEHIYTACVNPEMLNFIVGNIKFQNCGISKYDITVTKYKQCEDK